MSLPPALAKRLASRGLINNSSSNKKQPAPPLNKRRTNEPMESEEIIAEDYDEMEDPSQYDYEPLKKPQHSFWKEQMKLRIVEGNNIGYKGCPNKYNIYHKCTLFCVTEWGDGVLEPKRLYLRRKARLLRKYPLPKLWQEVYDSGCGCHYYWNQTDDTVAWLPPSHPKSIISKSAAALRKELEEIQPPQMDDDNDGLGAHDLTEEDIEKILSLPLPPEKKASESPERQTNQIVPNANKKQKSRDLDKAIRQQKSQRRNRGHNYRRGGDNFEDPLDPMDPAAYSDIARGKWSDGLNQDEGGQKGAADPTVSGTAFQHRPYPNPGAVLQANSNAKGNQLNKNDRRRSDNFDEDDYY